MNHDTFQGALNAGQHQALNGYSLNVPFGTSNEMRIAHENSYHFWKNQR